LMDVTHGLIRTWRRCVDVFITVSEFARSKYVQAGWPADRLVVKYNTVRSPQEPAPAGNGPFVCLARLSAEKGVDVLLDAWGRAFPDGERRLLILGTGDREASLRARAATLRGVELAGFVPRPEALRLLASSRAAVVPSLSYEGFPRVVAEAFALGVPVVASRIGSLPEVVEDRRTGLLVDPASPAALADALRALASSDAVCDELGRRARAVYEERYSAESTTRRLVEIYERAQAVSA
jgi:glycosyltransferase involved in cell wall biosynthesis